MTPLGWLGRKTSTQTNKQTNKVLTTKTCDRNTALERSTSKPWISTLRKHAYSNILKVLPQKKKWKFSNKKFWYSLYVRSKHRLWLLVRKFYNQKRKIFRLKNSDFFHISAQNIDCGYSLELPRRGGSNEYPQSMCLSRNKKDNVYTCKPQFYYIKVRVKGVRII